MRSTLVINLGTATNRHRGEVTPFNVPVLAGHALTLDRFAWDPARGGFALRTEKRSAQGAERWEAT
ncbi:MAG TPA: hypothetical protein VF362_04025 [Demequinaceae bacterium]